MLQHKVVCRFVYCLQEDPERRIYLCEAIVDRTVKMGEIKREAQHRIEDKMGKPVEYLVLERQNDPYDRILLEIELEEERNRGI